MLIGAGETKAATADQRIIYNTDTGKLYFDIDGAGGEDAVLLARLTNHAALGLADFFIA